MISDGTRTNCHDRQYELQSMIRYIGTIWFECELVHVFGVFFFSKKLYMIWRGCKSFKDCYCYCEWVDEIDWLKTVWPVANNALSPARSSSWSVFVFDQFHSQQRHLACGVPQKHILAYHTMIEAIITPSLDSSFIRNPQPLCVAVAQRNPLPFLLKRESLALASSPDVLPE